jgi:curved DNA-binding protein CbpA
MSIVGSKDHYAALGLAPNADDVVVKAAYRALAKKHHPDRNSSNDQGASRKFREIQNAYEVLSDEEKRARYQQLLQGSRRHRASELSASSGGDVRVRLDDRWEYLIQKHPDLGKIYSGYNHVSPALAARFRLLVLGSRLPGHFDYIARRLERQFCRRHFTQYGEVQSLARRLLARRNRHGLRQLWLEVRRTRAMTRAQRRELVSRYEAVYLRPANAGLKPAGRAGAIVRGAQPSPLRHISIPTGGQAGSSSLRVTVQLGLIAAIMCSVLLVP